MSKVLQSWVRPIISIMGMSGFTVGFFMKMIDPVAYGILVTGTIVWWFKARDEEKANGKTETK